MLLEVYLQCSEVLKKKQIDLKHFSDELRSFYTENRGNKSAQFVDDTKARIVLWDSKTLEHKNAQKEVVYAIKSILDCEELIIGDFHKIDFGIN